MYEQYENLDELENIMTDANEFITERIKKLNKLNELGINPYPYNYDYSKKTYTKDICDNFDTIDEGEIFSLAGRIMFLRRMGNATFANIVDERGNIQIFFSKKLIGNENYNILKLIDVGDIVGIEGNVFKTKTGEITIRANKFELLSKSIRTLPEKYHGIQDSDLKQRHRSLDMIMNSEVKERFIKRSKAVTAIREYLNNMNFIECDTPVLDTKYGGGEAKPFKTFVNDLDCEVYMNVSPELYLKRLIVGGIERVYTFARSFRNEGIDRTHYPEFTLMECYMSYASKRFTINSPLETSFIFKPSFCSSIKREFSLILLIISSLVKFSTSIPVSCFTRLHIVSLFHGALKSISSSPYFILVEPLMDINTYSYIPSIILIISS